jgi:hypothetical protein
MAFRRRFGCFHWGTQGKKGIGGIYYNNSFIQNKVNIKYEIRHKNVKIKIKNIE